VFGLSAMDPSKSPRVAIRPDGGTVTLPPEAEICRWGVGVRRLQVGRWGWLLPHSIGRDASQRAHSVVDYFEHGLTRDDLGARDDLGSARRRSVDECRDRF